MLYVEDGSASGGVGAHERSEDSGSFLGGEADSIDSSGWSDTVGVSDMDQISAELANRGPQKSDLKLRYHFIRPFMLSTRYDLPLLLYSYLKVIYEFNLQNVLLFLTVFI